MKKIGLGFLLLGSLFLGSNAFADGTSGCGLGSQVWKGQSGLISHLSAMTTNGSSYSQTFGMTSGTSNCDVNKSVELERQKDVFVAQNHLILSEEMAQGQGEFLVAYAAVMGCDKASARFAQVTMGHYDQIFGSATNSAQVLAGTEAAIAGDSELSSTCKL
ncbi:MAG: hypothetical protein A2600_14230 [Candidatus Lambdaproteobacteria bacterium RIFOXYD1_FULL_56_27]|uniref:DUF3015 domain-containing protein n=1 Tax=Candidatus Lambdaproteobacteria bacterium RIFOXYD2_FULL_56_26 TaxID=1817773 RepID=A0A1F6GTL1_9PROT|nr:MAG: hypothetical protein A2426_03570 [Candidatus Lambdaproteobacteria bacterium RIFOXYC1_FULL_56_13]OGH01487.1 MAG: hypothetical protein A2557_04505 [Candidatus Lambdaproteobacteria bacterium RIFOXYD2_FULL_56_26]OGH06717.1 MAG: hypothetical protein A2600_14230 [Candidatus Lambdaproteobacteria bacterium RIFOXYD1_FULL_56_27]